MAFTYDPDSKSYSDGNVTLALTLADGSTTEAIPCYYGGSVRLGTQYGAGNIVRLTYRAIPTTAFASERRSRPRRPFPREGWPSRTRKAASHWRPAYPLT